MTHKEELILAISKRKPTTPKTKAIHAYALEILAAMHSAVPITEEEMLRGSRDWRAYSWGDRSLTNTKEIIFRLKGAAEFEKWLFAREKGMEKIKWRDEQARALQSAARLILSLTK